MAEKKKKPLASKAKSKQVARNVKYERSYPDDVKLTFSDGMAVQQHSGVFYVAFFQNQHPILASTQELNKLKSIEQRAIARLIITPTNFANILEALESNFNKFLEQLDDIDASNYKEFLEFVRENEKGKDSKTKGGKK